MKIHEDTTKSSPVRYPIDSLDHGGPGITQPGYESSSMSPSGPVLEKIVSKRAADTETSVIGSGPEDVLSKKRKIDTSQSSVFRFDQELLLSDEEKLFCHVCNSQFTSLKVSVVIMWSYVIFYISNDHHL